MSKSRLSGLFSNLGSLFGGGRSSEGKSDMPDGLREYLKARGIDPDEMVEVDLSEGIGSLFGSLSARLSGQSEVPDYTKLVEQKVGSRLMRELKLEAQVEVANAHLKANQKVAQQDCAQHQENERRMQSEIDRLNARVESLRGHQSASDRRNGQFRALLSEIMTAVGAGMPLTVGIIDEGIARAETRGFQGLCYLTFPPPPEPFMQDVPEASAPVPKESGEPQ